MLTLGIKLKNFKIKKKINLYKVKKNLKILFDEKNYILESLKKKYRDSYSKKFINNYNKYKNFRVIGMGGSTLGTQTIYEFLKDKIKKNFHFIDNLSTKKIMIKNSQVVNLIVSKSGNTIETIVNSNVYIKKENKNIFITENKNNYLFQLASKLKSEVIHHNNYIGGRYSVLSEVGMLPADLMGLKTRNFRQLNSLIKNKAFINSLIISVASTLYYLKNKKNNSIIINYDEKSENLFKWYQQLVAESLGKKQKGIFPLISTMPKDNHSMMQLYLDGPKKSFFTFFDFIEKKSDKIKNKLILSEHNFLKNKKLFEVLSSQKKGSENVFFKNSVPFRSFEILNRNEETMGELFTFFILETILIAKAIKVNPYDQPSVELIKKDTKRILKNI